MCIRDRFYSVQEEGEYICAKCRACRFVKCKCCNKSKQLCYFPETVEEHAARRHVSLEKAVCNMICDSCKKLHEDRTSFRLCTECDIRTPMDEMARRSGTNKVLDRCAECAFPACASCGRRRAVKDGMVHQKDKMILVQDGVTRKEWYCE